MVLTISTTTGAHRHDSTILPVFTVGGITDLGYFKIADWLYIPAVNGANTLIMPNRSSESVAVKVRDNIVPDWEVETGITVSNADIFRASGEGYNGAYYDTPLSDTKGSIQATATSTALSAGISLQDNTNTILHSYFNASVAHGIILGQNGGGIILELGVIVGNGQFKYSVGDTAMIEYDIPNNIVKYYLIKPDGEMITLRTTRSKLTEAPKAEVMLYFTGSRLNNVVVNSDLEAQVAFENIGVMYHDEDTSPTYWQKFGNQQSIQSTADALEMADKSLRYTFPNRKRSLETYGLTPKAYTREQFAKFLDFVRWHNTDKEFIFIDGARFEKDGTPHEIWAQMSSAFVNSALNGCVYEMSQGIVESYRNDYIPILIDSGDPAALLYFVGQTDPPSAFIVAQGAATDNVLVTGVQAYINGEPYGEPFLPEPDATFELMLPITEFVLGNNEVYVVVTDYAGRTAQSNTGIYYNPLTLTDYLYDIGRTTGGTVGGWLQDNISTGGSVISSSQPWTTTGITNPPPPDMLDSVRYGASFSFLKTGFTPDTFVLVRLFSNWHNVDYDFDVEANGVSVGSLAFDAPNDNYKVKVLEFSANADEDGNLLIECSSSNNALVSAIAISGYTATPVAVSKRIITVGDSITQGEGVGTTSEGETYPNKLALVIGGKSVAYDGAETNPDSFTGWEVVNKGVSGESIQNFTTRVAAINALYDAGFSRNVVVILGGTNNLYNGDTPAAAFAHLQTFIAALNGGFEVYVCTLTHRSAALPGTQLEWNANSDAFNSLIRDAYASTLIDLASLSEMSDATNTVYFQDGLHPTAIGNQVIANEVKKQIGA